MIIDRANREQWLAAAYHEASHAVVAHVLGFTVTRIHVDPSAWSRCPHIGWKPTGGTPLAQMAVYTAGELGERHHSGGPLLTENEGDRTKLDDLSKLLVPDDPGKQFDAEVQARLIAASILDDHWLWVDSVVNELLGQADALASEAQIAALLFELPREPHRVPTSPWGDP